MKMSFSVSFARRAKGLLFESPSNSVLLLAPCKSVHTFGMAYAIDIAFVDASGIVVKTCRDVLPQRRRACRRACAVLERYACPSNAWFRVGDFVSVSCGHLIEGGSDGVIEEDLGGFLEEEG